ncbi:MAG: O-antigen ligase family protein [Planctomycetota bacterium]
MNAVVPDLQFLAQTGKSFLTEYREGLFFSALALFALSGLFVGMFDVIKRVFVVGFALFLIFPTTDIHFFVDLKYIGVTRGLYITLSDLFLLSLFIGTLVGASRHRLRFFPRGVPVYILFMLFCALSLVNARDYAPGEFVNPGYAYGLFELFNIFKGLILMWVMINFIRSESEIKFLLYTFIGLVLVETLYVVYAHFVLHQWGRAAGSLGHSNGLAMYAGMFVPLALVMAMTYRGKGLVTLMMVLALLGGFTMIVKSGARAGIGATLVTSSIAGFLVLRNARRLNWSRLAGIALVFLIGASFVVTRYWDRLMLRFGQVAEEAQVSTESRVRLLEAGWDIAQKNMVTGVGLNNFPIEIYMDPKYFASRAEEHNLYLLTLAETGVLGLGAMLLLFFRLFYIGWRKVYKQNYSISLKIVSIGVMCGMLHILMQSYFEFLFRAIFVSYFFWMLGAILIASSYLVDNKVATVRLLRRRALLSQLQNEKKRQACAEAGTLSE